MLKVIGGGGVIINIERLLGDEGRDIFIAFFGSGRHIGGFAWGHGRREGDRKVVIAVQAYGQTLRMASDCFLGLVQSVQSAVGVREVMAHVMDDATASSLISCAKYRVTRYPCILCCGWCFRC